MDTIAHGLLAEGLVKTWRAEGMRGDPAFGIGVNNLLRNIQYVTREHIDGQRVTLGEFEVLEGESESDSADVIPPLKQKDPDDQPD
jgi:hypothetical protein